jgi:hypothetical protein
MKLVTKLSTKLITNKGLFAASCLTLGLVTSFMAEPLINSDRLSAIALTSPGITKLNNILNQTVFGDEFGNQFGDEKLTRYAAAVNAIENKRLEIFRSAKNNSSWVDVANLAESQQTKVCDLTQPPDFLQDLCSQLRIFTEKEIHRRGFTNKEFNQITRQQRQDPSLRKTIQSKQMQLRGSK